MPGGRGASMGAGRGFDPDSAQQSAEPESEGTAMSRLQGAVVVSVGLMAGCASGPKAMQVSKARESLVAIEQQKLQVADQAPGDKLGSSVAVLGETAVLGDPSDDNGWSSEAGSVRVFAG